METKEFLALYDLWPTDTEGHDVIETTLRQAGVLVFRIEKAPVHHNWRVVARLPGGGGIDVRLQFAARIRLLLQNNCILDGGAEIYVGGSGPRVTLSFIARIGQPGGVCYNRNRAGQIIPCWEQYRLDG